MLLCLMKRVSINLMKSPVLDHVHVERSFGCKPCLSVSISYLLKFQELLIITLKDPDSYRSVIGTYVPNHQNDHIHAYEMAL